ncbi:hypothetical protein Smic_37850 [Streptomyces microflavus]|uniref:Endonuclease GajA/Old nuclease/RecF-like AAA domain-containing protein n=1 Tax=Streptomyces microflavus TaxID=1919 RepID=A0A7J0CSF5_STRMI|nr:hypothetical protein Smic_37850 [Streptomyces microflavus]
MLISNVRVQNYRGLRDLSLPVSPFGCIIGENNAGKSSILQALDIFFSGPILKDSDFYDAGNPLRIEVTLDEIKDEDLARLAEEHRGRIEKVANGGRLTLSRVYDAPGKGLLRQVDDVPINKKYWPSSVQEMVAGKRGEELKESAVYAFPDLRDILPPKPTQKDVKEAIAALANSLHQSERTKGDVDLPTGMEKSIQALLPEVIYIPAVKELSDDLKTSESASFGKLLSILVEQIKPQLADVDELFGKLRGYLNVEALPEGGVNDRRLDEVRNIEQLVEGNLQAAFPDTRVSIEIPHRISRVFCLMRRLQSMMASGARSRARGMVFADPSPSRFFGRTPSLGLPCVIARRRQSRGPTSCCSRSLSSFCTRGLKSSYLKLFAYFLRITTCWLALTRRPFTARRQPGHS